jgi:hypothetical protein
MPVAIRLVTNRSDPFRVDPVISRAEWDRTRIAGRVDQVGLTSAW